VGDKDVRVSCDATGAANLDVMDRLDFEALNRGDWNLFAALHHDDVTVHWKGERLEGLAAHAADVQQALVTMPEAPVVGHPIAFAAGDWVCVVAEIAGGGRAVVIARLADGRIAEEHIFDG